MTNDRLVLKGLETWEDFDVALFAVGCALGVLPLRYADIPNAKALFWSSNPINNCLSGVLRNLIEIGYVLHDEATDKYKVNDKFDLKNW